MPFLASVFTPETASVLRHPKAATVLFFLPLGVPLSCHALSPMERRYGRCRCVPLVRLESRTWTWPLASHEATRPPISPQTVPSRAEHIPDRQSLERRSNRAAESPDTPRTEGKAMPKDPHTPTGTLVHSSPRLGSRMSGPLAVQHLLIRDRSEAPSRVTLVTTHSRAISPRLVLARDNQPS